MTTALVASLAVAAGAMAGEMIMGPHQPAINAATAAFLAVAAAMLVFATGRTIPRGRWPVIALVIGVGCPVATALTQVVVEYVSVSLFALHRETDKLYKIGFSILWTLRIFLVAATTMTLSTALRKND